MKICPLARKLAQQRKYLPISVKICRIAKIIVKVGSKFCQSPIKIVRLFNFFQSADFSPNLVTLSFKIRLAALDSLDRKRDKILMDTKRTRLKKEND